MRVPFRGAAIALAVALSIPSRRERRGTRRPRRRAAQRVAFTVDNVPLSVPRSFAAGRSSGPAGRRDPGDDVVAPGGTRTLSIIAVPTARGPLRRPPLPGPPGGAPAYRNALAVYRGTNGQNPRTGPPSRSSERSSRACRARAPNAS